jgi:hypothetical protein
MTWVYQLLAHLPRAEVVVPVVVVVVIRPEGVAAVVAAAVEVLPEAGEAAVVREVLHYPESGEVAVAVVAAVGVQGQNHSVGEAAVQTEALFCQAEAEQVLSDGPRGAAVVAAAQMERLK